jgi:hypothetical protein
MGAADESALGRVVQGTGSYTSRQGSVYAPGIGAETVAMLPEPDALVP